MYLRKTIHTVAIEVYPTDRAAFHRVRHKKVDVHRMYIGKKPWGPQGGTYGRVEDGSPTNLITRYADLAEALEEKVNAHLDLLYAENRTAVLLIAWWRCPGGFMSKIVELTSKPA